MALTPLRWAQYTVNVPTSGTYNVKVQVKKHPNRGIAQLYVDGVARGAIDEYARAQAYELVFRKLENLKSIKLDILFSVK